MTHLFRSLFLLAIASPAFAHGDGTIHSHNQEYALWAVALGLIVYLAVRFGKGRN